MIGLFGRNFLGELNCGKSKILSPKNSTSAIRSAGRMEPQVVAACVKCAKRD